jgi:hypothetical protein
MRVLTYYRKIKISFLWGGGAAKYGVRTSDEMDGNKNSKG